MYKPRKTVCSVARMAWMNISRMYNSEAQAYELSTSAAFLLLHLGEEGTQVGQLAGLLGMEASSMTRILRSIEKRGWVVRSRQNEQDRREVKLMLTPEGQAARQIARDYVRKFNRHVQDLVSEHDLQAFYRVSDAIQRVVQQTLLPDTILQSQL
ncbi:MAG: MarR family transcriptional regulator [Sphingomonadales bacterium]|nr:MarR family transcriptional regulator [Sphingomonadales bacterium]